MKKSKFTEEQIAFMLHQAETGVSVEEVCPKTGDVLCVEEEVRRRLRQLEEENRKLKQLGKLCKTPSYHPCELR